MTDITLLDGGMGQELVARAGGKATPLWSTQALIDNPDLVGEVHTDYAAAGATVATTDTYALHRDRLRGGDSNHYAAAGLDIPDMEDKIETLILTAVAQSHKVRDKGRVAGSIGPLGASYRSDIHPDTDAAIPLYAEIAHILAPGVDVILFETVASLKAARACVAAGRQTNRPVWIAFTVDDEDGSLLRSGEPLREAAAIAADADAALANCSAPEAMPRALETLATANVPTGAYANAFTMITKAFLAGGTTAQDLQARRDMGPEIYANHVLSWIDNGATIVGGCCETGPAHIAEIARRVQAEGHTLI